MADQYVERVENIIRVVGRVRDEDFDLRYWCKCAVGHAVKDAYFIALGFNPRRDVEPGQSLMPGIGKFFDISAARAAELFVENPHIKYESRKDVLAALRVLLLEKMAQQIEIGIPTSWSAPRIEELADVAA